jgi:hypothetical protein
MSRTLKCLRMSSSPPSSSFCESPCDQADGSSCLIVFQNIVPISLYITIEIVKTVQAYFIFQDVEMYYDACKSAVLAYTDGRRHALRTEILERV